MKQTTRCLLCPHCINSDHPLEKNGISWLKCPLCGLSFRSKELKGNSITKGYLPDYLQKKLDFNKEVDSQMDHMVQESTDNLMHEIIMCNIFKEKAKKDQKETKLRSKETELRSEGTELRSELDKLFDVIFA